MTTEPISDEALAIAQKLADAMAPLGPLAAQGILARLTAAEADLRRIRAAIASKGGSEHAPIEWAYEQACAALDKHRARADAAEAERDAAIARAEAPIVARPLDEWHEDMGDVVWWVFPIQEPAWIGSPQCDDWPGYHTHWTPHPKMPVLP